MQPEDTHSITLTQGVELDLDKLIFSHSTDGTPGSTRTKVRLIARDNLLTVHFECLDNPHWRFNNYTRHNTDLWRQEVFEIFIAAGDEVPSRYLELEINPNNALFAAWVENLSGQMPEKLTMLPHPDHGIQHQVNTEPNQWSGHISIPLSLLSDSPSTSYRINFYRIVLRSEPSQSDWECDPGNCDFLCWSPTMSGEEPAFHRPGYFGSLRILSKTEV